MASPALLPRILQVFLCCLILSAGPVRAAEPLLVLVTGVEGEILENVQAVLSIPPGTVENGKVNLPWLERFERQIPEKVKMALEPFGYYNGSVTVQKEAGDEKNQILRVTVALGAPVLVTETKIAIQGPGAQDDELGKLASAFPLKKGDILNAEIYEKLKGELQNSAIGLGYLEAEFAVHRILVSLEKSGASIELVLETGPRYLFGEVSFTGAEIYPETFLRRYLAFNKGEVFSGSALSQTQLNLINSDRFKDVAVFPEREKAQGFMVPVLIKLDPSLPKRLRFGAGYGTDTGARGVINYRDLNVSHRGHEFDSELNVSEISQGLVAGYRVPGGDVDSFVGLQLKLRQEEVTTYASKLVSLEISKTMGFGRARVGTVYVNLQKEDSTIGEETVNVRLVMPGLRFSQHWYDDLLRPRKGYRYGLELRGTDQLLGSDVGLIQILGDGKLIVPLPERLTLITRVQGAASILKEGTTSLPASLRFFTGGDNSVRGYSYQSLGPMDATGSVAGGRNLLVGSLEVERAVLKDWGVAGFYDIGNSFDIFSDIKFAQGAGVGVRYYTPVGAIRLDIARQFGVEDPRFRLHFTMGFQL